MLTTSHYQRCLNQNWSYRLWAKPWLEAYGDAPLIVVASCIPAHRPIISNIDQDDFFFNLFLPFRSILFTLFHTQIQTPKKASFPRNVKLLLRLVLLRTTSPTTTPRRSLFIRLHAIHIRLHDAVQVRILPRQQEHIVCGDGRPAGMITESF